MTLLDGEIVSHPALLPRQSTCICDKVGVAAPRIDVQSTPACIARVDRQCFWLAKAHQVVENALHTLLMELIVVAKGNDVAQ